MVLLELCFMYHSNTNLILKLLSVMVFGNGFVDLGCFELFGGLGCVPGCSRRCLVVVRCGVW